MYRVKNIAVICLPWLLVACSHIPVPAPENSLPSSAPQAQDKYQSKPRLAPVDDAAIAPVVVITLLKKAQQQLDNGEQQAAAASLERAIRIAPRYPEGYLRLGELRYLQGRTEQARALAQKALILGADGLLRMQAQALIEQISADQ